MDSDRQRTYRVHEFAELTGVSVRALHHYDRLGLLKPRRAASRYRIYVADDVAVLEQIVALKFIGVPLTSNGCCEPSPANFGGYWRRSERCSRKSGGDSISPSTRFVRRRTATWRNRVR